jgi:hypothetical protein
MNTKKLLLKAHLEYEIKQFKGKVFENHIDDNIIRLFNFFDTITIEEIIRKDNIVSLYKYYVIEQKTPVELHNIIIKEIKSIFDLLKNNDTKINELISKENFNELIKSISNMKEMRDNIIKQVASTSLYSMLISNIMYNGIKDFILAENILVKNIPGASSLIKFGQDLLNKTLPKVEEGIDKKLREFIQSNIQDSISKSESFMKKTINEKLIIKLGEEIWNGISNNKISDYFPEKLNMDEIDNLSIAIDNIWNDFKTGEFYSSIIELVISNFYDEYGNKTIKYFLDDFNVSIENLSKQIKENSSFLLENKKVMKFIETMIEERLDTFYNSKEADEIFSSI